MSGEPLLKTCGLGRRKAGAEEWLLRGICLELRPGDRLSVVGPTGSGKTLLLRALALLDPLDEGTVTWRGRAVGGEAVTMYRREVVYLHQRPALFEGSVEENLHLPFSLAIHRGASFDRGRVLTLLEALGLDETFLNKSARDLSGGEGQIVSLLRAIQLGPSILLLDEPTASLDADSVAAVEILVTRWQAEAPGERATVWVSHDAEQARRVGQRELRMDAGQLRRGRDG